MENTVKENDWLVSLLENPEAQLNDFYEAGFSEKNTGIQDRDFYKAKTYIQEKFTNEEGAFDEMKFDQFYDLALSGYQVFAHFEKGDILEDAEYHFADLYRPAKSKISEDFFRMRAYPNPFKEVKGTLGIGTTEDSNFSAAEIAQTGHVVDFETGETLNYTANDLGGLNVFKRFVGFGGPTLVLARWEEEGYHKDPETGQMVLHKPGEFKLNEYGELHYETLGKRDAAKHQFLSNWDILTVDGSFANRFDPFDSDDREKSITGIVTKTGSYLLPLIIGSITGEKGAKFTKGYMLATALLNAIKHLPNLYKALDGVAVGTALSQFNYDKKTPTWRAMNALAAWGKSNNWEVSEYSKNSMFTFENFANLTADVFMQLGQLVNIALFPQALGMHKRYIAGIDPSDIEGLNAAYQKFNNFSKRLSSSYMVLTSGAQVYDRAILAGHSERTAGWITLGTLAGLYGLMQTEYAQHALRRVGYDDIMPHVNRAVRNEAEHMAGTLAEAGFRGGVTQAQNISIAKKVANAVSGFYRRMVDDPSTFLNAGLNETLEEVTEEITEDTMMMLGAAFSNLGLTDSEGRYGFSDIDWKHTMERYTMSAAGGFVGGATNHLKFLPWNKMHGSLLRNRQSDRLLQSVYEFGAAEVHRAIDRANFSAYINPEMSTTLDEAKAARGEIAFLDASNGRQSLEKFLKERLHELVDGYNSAFETLGVNRLTYEQRHGLAITDNKELNTVLTNLGLDQAVTEQIKYYTSQAVDAMAKRAEFEEGTEEHQRLTDLINHLVEQRDAVMQGKDIDRLVKMTLIELTPNLSRLFVHANINDFAEAMTGKKYDELTDKLKEQVEREYERYVKKDGPDNKSKKEFQLWHAVDLMDMYTKRFLPFMAEYTSDNFRESRRRAMEVMGHLFQEMDEVVSSIFSRDGSTVNHDALKRLEALGRSLSPDRITTNLAEFEQELMRTGEKAEDYIKRRKEELKRDRENLKRQRELLELTGMFTAEQEESITRANREIDMMEAQVDSWYDATKAQAKIDQVKALETDAKQKEADLRQQLESGAIDQKTFNEKLAEIKNNHKQAVNNMVAALRADAINQAIIQLKKDGIPVYSEIFLLIQEEVGRLRNLRRQGFDLEADSYNEYAEHALGAANLFLGLDLEFSKIFKNFNFAEMMDEEIAAVVDSMNLSEILGIDEAELGAKLFAALDEYSHSTTDETTAVQDFKELLKENIKEIRDSQNEITEKIEEIRNNLSSSVVNPMYLFLNELSLANESGNQGLLEALQQEQARLKSGEVSQYILTNPEQAMNTLEDIEIAIGLISAFSDISGYTKIMNFFYTELSKRKEAEIVNPEESLTLSLDNSIDMMTDLFRLKNRILFLLNLSNYNQSDRLRFHKNTAANFYGLFFRMFDDDDTTKGLIWQLAQDPELKELVEGFSLIFEENLDAIEKLKNAADIVKNGATYEDLKIMEQAMVKLEDKFFENFQKVQEKFKGNEEALVQKLKDLIFPKLTEEERKKKEEEGEVFTTTQISQNTEHLKDYDKLTYLLAIGSIKSSDYKRRVLDILGKKVGADNLFKYSPLFAQEYASMVAFATFKNREIFNAVPKAVRISDTDPVLSNSVFINGYHGTGKTTATGLMLYNLLQTEIEEKDMTISAIVSRQAQKLKDTLRSTLLPNTKELLLNKILRGKKVDDYVNDEKVVDSEKIKNEIGDTTEIGKVIFIDEITHYSSKELLLITEWAKQNDKFFVFLGDTLQSGQLSDIQYVEKVQTPTLEFSMRSGWSTTKQNVDVFREMTLAIDVLDASTETRKKIKEEFALRTSAQDFVLKHAYVEGLLVGHKFTKDQAEIETMLELLKNKGVNMQNVAIIYDSDSGDKLKALKEKYGVAFVNINEMQGAEFDYAIIKADLKQPITDTDTIKWTKLMNTLLSRASKGTLVVTENQMLNDCSEVDKFPVDMANNSSKMNELLAEFRAKRVEALESVAGTTTRGHQNNPNPSGPTAPLGIEVLIENAILETPEQQKQRAQQNNEQDKEAGKRFGQQKGRNVDDSIVLGSTSLYSAVDIDLDVIGGADVTNQQLQRYDKLRIRIAQAMKGNKLYSEDTKKLIRKALEEALRDNPKKDDLLKKFDEGYEFLLNVYYEEDVDAGDVKSIETFSNRPAGKEILMDVLLKFGDHYIGIGKMFTKPGDTKYNEIAAMAKKGDPDVYLKINDAEVSGYNTRSHQVSHPLENDYSLEEYLNDGTYKAHSSVLIWTGHSTYATELANLERGTDKAKKFEELLKRYNLAGKPVIFISRDPDFDGASDEKFINQFLDLLKDRADSEASGQPRKVEDKVQLVVLNTRKNSVDQYLRQFYQIMLDLKDGKSGAKEAIHRLGNRFVGLLMLRAFKQYLENPQIKRQYEAAMKASKNKKGKEFWNAMSKELAAAVKVYFDVLNILSLVENMFGIKVIYEDKTKTYQTVYADNNEMVNPGDTGLARLNAIIDKITKKFSDKSDIRKLLYKHYYNKELENINDFNFSDIVTLLVDLVVHDGDHESKFLKLMEDEDWRDEKARKPIIQLLKASEDFEEDFKDSQDKEISQLFNSVIEALSLDGSPFADGVPVHAIFKGSKEAVRGTNFVEMANNNLSDFTIDKNFFVDSQRFLIDFESVESEETHAKRQQEAAEKLAKFEQSIRDFLKANPNLAVGSKFEALIKGKTAEEINKLFAGMSFGEINSYITSSDGQLSQVKINEDGTILTTDIKDLAVHKAASIFYDIFDTIVGINYADSSITYRFKKADGSSIEIVVRKTGETVTVTTKNEIKSAPAVLTKAETFKATAESMAATLGMPDVLTALTSPDTKAATAAAIRAMGALSKLEYRLERMKFLELLREKLEIDC